MVGTIIKTENTDRIEIIPIDKNKYELKIVTMDDTELLKECVVLTKQDLMELKSQLMNIL